MSMWTLNTAYAPAQPRLPCQSRSNLFVRNHWELAVAIVYILKRKPNGDYVVHRESWQMLKTIMRGNTARHFMVLRRIPSGIACIVPKIALVSASTLLVSSIGDGLDVPNQWCAFDLPFADFQLVFIAQFLPASFVITSLHRFSRPICCALQKFCCHSVVRDFHLPHRRK